MDNQLVCLLISICALLLLISKATKTEAVPLRAHSDVIFELRSDQSKRIFHFGEEISSNSEKYEKHKEVTATTHGIITSKDSNCNSLSPKKNGSDDSKFEVVKLVTSGSNIVFLDDEPDEDDVMINSAHTAIRRKKETPKSTPQLHHSQHGIQQEWQQRIVTDEIKVAVAVVSNSSLPEVAFVSKNPLLDLGNIQQQRSEHKRMVGESVFSTIPKPAVSISPAIVPSQAEVINLSHKGVFMIEGATPLSNGHNTSSDTDSTYFTSVGRVGPTTASQSAATPATYHRSDQSSNAFVSASESKGNKQFRAMLPEDQLLQFQTVIYHDTNESHSPQSRSISYSSLSQNVDEPRTSFHDLAPLSEYQQNVSDSQNLRLQSSGSARTYSVPAKMYSMPSKFYSEPSKIYSQPAKVYAEPEQIYSEPAKMYGEPSKIYSEPAKIYSQPAKVYGKPAKTYWPPPLSPSSAGTKVTTTSNGTLKIETKVTSSTHRPGIISRIAFGQNRVMPVSANAERLPLHSNIFHRKHRLQQSSSIINTDTRRFFFNSDKLPYDLLNAPEQTTNHANAAGRSEGTDGQDPSMEPSSTPRTSPFAQPQQSSLLDQNTKGFLRIDEFNSGQVIISDSQRGAGFTTTVAPSIHSKMPGVREFGGETYSVLYRSKDGKNGGYSADDGQALRENNSDDGSNSKNPNTNNGSDDSKVAYVVEGRNYRRYRVEEETDDGFIVGEYGVVDHNDGNLRGVRYTADSTINRSLIQKALLTFLKLK